nr:MAG TPA: Major capsid protein [Microviridae sp.]
MDFNLTNDINPKLNAFDLGHNHFTTINMGDLVPISWLECVPGDIFNLDMEMLVRAQPMLAPIMNNLTCDIHAFFVPTRLLWKDWESFCTTIIQDSIPPKTFEGTPPVWGQKDDVEQATLPNINLASMSLWDYFGFSRIFKVDALADKRPLDFLRRAYYFIWNEWFRDENLQEPIDYYNTDRQDVLKRAWRKDYFTASYVGRQKGTSPSVPLSGTGSVKWTKQFFTQLASVQETNEVFAFRKIDNKGIGMRAVQLEGGIGSYPTLDQTNQAFLDFLNDNSFDMSNVGTFDTNDLREMFQIQKFLERLMMAGSRYIEFLQSQFGVSPSDSRLQIPERIGGTSFNIKISEVIATAETELANGEVNPQGNQSGHGLSVSAGSLGTYKAVEFGYIIVLANIQPPAVYVDRIPKEMFRKTLLEQYNPHFVNLSFQATENREIYAQGTTEDEGIFAYAGRYDEMREKQSYISGDMYDKLDFYLNFRKFTTLPRFNSDFIECKPDNHIFKVQDEPPFLCNFYCDFKALRPLPLVSEPSLIDHVYGGI